MSEEDIIEDIKKSIKWWDEKHVIHFNTNTLQGLLDLYSNTKKSEEILANKLQNVNIELSNIKEIEQQHKEENGKLRIELGQYKLLEANIDKANKIIAENKFDEGLYGLFMQEKEKNKELYEQNQIYLSNGSNVKLELHIKNNYISKDKIKEKIEELVEQGDYRTAENPNGRVHFNKEPVDYQLEILKELLEEK